MMRLLGLSPRPLDDPQDLAARWPANILTTLAVDTLTFADIEQVRNRGRACGYFDAVAAVQANLGAAEFWPLYVAFLEKLADYLKDVGLVAKVALSGYPRERIREELARDASRARLWWAVPVILASGVGGTVGVVTASITPYVPAALAVGMAVGQGLEKLRTGQHEVRRRKVESVLGGDTVAPLRA